MAWSYDYRVLDRTAQLVISAVGMHFEHSASHVLVFQAIKILPLLFRLAADIDDISVKDVWATAYALFTSKKPLPCFCLDKLTITKSYAPIYFGLVSGKQRMRLHPQR